MPETLHSAPFAAPPRAAPLDVTQVHDAHADFVWASLQRLGVREADLEDMLQEVFVVVYQRLHTYEGRSLMTTWLFGICMRVAASYRRRAYNRRERTVEHMPDEPPPSDPRGPEEALASRQARARLDEILDGMELEKRAVFVMFEIDEMPCDQIASITGVPIGTVYSRLHAARKAFEAAVARHKARDERGGRS